ncbi:MFS transporter [Candidatus Sodalis sp. SoCistrobi]|uniref:MFS transporter n=1 Tax=Candidatus Sodalis sp. SoCistrobi TaxID=1922216 RepID=UPI001C2638E7|nr:MFS transporter [Candidatus Sodalis sp. SoCistrobi]
MSIDKNVKRAIFASTLGTIIEWYDYGLYAAPSGLIINKLFFPELSQLGGMLAAFATFAIGFIIRPVGGVVISHIGDKFGRKPALIFCISIMGVATVGVGLLPTWHSIGIWAPILLIFLRLLQGFGAGAELAGAITLVAEYTPVKRRGFFTAIPNTAINFGVLIATLTFLFFSWLPEETLLSWVWRVPFLLSVLLFVIALYIRAKLDETPEYVNAMENAQRQRQEQKAPIRQLFKESPRELLCGFFAMGGHQALTYVLNTFALSYMINTLGMSKTDGLMVLIIALTFTLICGPIGGWLAARYGSAKIFICGALFALFFVYPLFYLVDTKNPLLAALGVSAIYGISWGCTGGAQGAFLSNLFPTRYRFSGIAMCRELSGALIGGPTPFIATALVALGGGRPTWVMVYLGAFCLFTVIAVALGKHLSRHDEDGAPLVQQKSNAEPASSL